MKKLFILCVLSTAHFMGFAQNPVTNTFAIYAHNLALTGINHNPANYHFTSQDDNINVVKNRLSPDLGSCEKEVLQIGGSFIGTSSPVWIYHYDVQANNNVQPGAIPALTAIGTTYNGWTRVASGNINNYVHVKMQPNIGEHYFCMVGVQNGMTGNFFSYLKLEVYEAFTIDVDPVCEGEPIQVAVNGCAVDATIE